jgi:hypothetical protein
MAVTRSAERADGAARGDRAGAEAAIIGRCGALLRSPPSALVDWYPAGDKRLSSLAVVWRGRMRGRGSSSPQCPAQAADLAAQTRLCRSSLDGAFRQLLGAVPLPGRGYHEQAFPTPATRGDRGATAEQTTARAPSTWSTSWGPARPALRRVSARFRSPRHACLRRGHPQNNRRRCAPTGHRRDLPLKATAAQGKATIGHVPQCCKLALRDLRGDTAPSAAAARFVALDKGHIEGPASGDRIGGRQGAKPWSVPGFPLDFKTPVPSWAYASMFGSGPSGKPLSLTCWLVSAFQCPSSTTSRAD